MERWGGSVIKFMLFHRWPYLVVMVIFSLFAAVLGLAAPFFQKVFVDHLTGVQPEVLYGQSPFARVETELFGFHALWILVAAFASMLVAQWLTTFTNWLGVREAVRRQEILSDTIYRKTLSLRLDQTAGQTVGEVVSIYATDVPGSTAIVDQTIPLGAGVIFPFVCAPLAVKVICDIPVGATVMVMVFVLSISIALSIRQSRFFQNFKRLAADRTGLVNEWIQNIRLLRILGWVDRYETKIFTKREEETVNRVKMVTNGQMMGSFGSSVNFFLNLVAVIALTRMKGADATPGDYFALLWIFGVFLSRPFRQVPWIFTFTFDGWTSLKRIDRLLMRYPDSMQGMQAAASQRALAKPPKGPSSLEVKDLNLVIDGRRILSDVTFSLEAGEIAAVVGEVGSGKSLLLVSLLGETGSTAKTLRVGEAALENKSREERRVFFGFVPQDGFVMSASLRENIAFRYQVGSESDAGILKALRAAQFDPDHEGVVDGLAAEIGERGVNLSGGQRQRIGLARAAYLKRPVILLDDALSAVDVETERLLFDSLLFGEWRETTRIMVTHRLSVLNRVDRVLFMKDGRLVDQGTMAQLVARNEEFRGFIHSMGTEASSAPGRDSKEVEPV
ncbi:MAG: ABC transporter ATP-binding protein [Bdellovibrionales bacterium]|jgi:ABC-type multidrug transport system fused ATPase/permease subunit|nr:ABC transporter ATP-binding protein [Bdellovibrionales bacterium]